MGKSMGDEYRRLLDEAMAGGDDESPVVSGEALSEAEQYAHAAEKPKLRKDGKPVGSNTPRARPLTSGQMEFCKGVIRGESLRKAYRVAFNNSTASDASISASANKLMNDERVQRILQEAWGETVEHLVDDVVASKRYVLKGLLALSQRGAQEGTKLKALELMGKTIGMFTQQEVIEKVEVSTEQLRKELANHLRMLERAKPSTVIADADVVRTVERVNEARVNVDVA
jgi:hypothetical protein